jgi:hypothetical protein
MMERRILAVGNDWGLLLTRVALLNLRWTTAGAFPKDALVLLQGEIFDLLVLCHTLRKEEAAILVDSVRTKLPNLQLLALQTPSESRENLTGSPIAFTLDSPAKLLDEVERLFITRGIAAN